MQILLVDSRMVGSATEVRGDDNDLV